MRYPADFHWSDLDRTQRPVIQWSPLQLVCLQLYNLQIPNGKHRYQQTRLSFRTIHNRYLIAIDQLIVQINRSPVTPDEGSHPSSLHLHFLHPDFKGLLRKFMERYETIS